MKELIMKAIDLSALAYEPKEKIIKAITDVRCFDIPYCDVQGFVHTQGKKTWVVIRGTEIDNFDDWKTNFNIGFIKSAWGDVHGGFYLDAVATMQEIRKYLLLAEKRGHTIVFTGHSLGGITALMLYANFMYGNLNNHQCIPIEAPRGFSEEAANLFGSWFGKNIHPIVHNNDIVTRLPPKIMGYAHIPGTDLHYITRKGKVKNKIPKWDRLLGYLQDLGKIGLDCVKDHDIDRIAVIWRKLLT